MMLFVLETGLRQSRTGLLAKFTKSPPTSSTDHSPPLINQRRCSFQPQNDDTLQLVTNNPFETASSTNTDLRDIDIDEEEGSLKGELKYEDLSVENYSNPFGQQGSQGGQESPSPPPLRGMSVSVNGAELGGSGGPKVSSSFVSSGKFFALFFSVFLFSVFFLFVFLFFVFFFFFFLDFFSVFLSLSLKSSLPLPKKKNKKKNVETQQEPLTNWEKLAIILSPKQHHPTECT